MASCFGWCFHQRNKDNEKEQVEISAAAGSNGAEALAAVEDRVLVPLPNPEFKTYKVGRVEVSESQFIEMFEKIGNIKHENLLPLRAYQIGNEMVINYDKNVHRVYEFMRMGSLSANLHGNRGAEKKKTPLNWETRLGIIVGVARAIAYLHSLGPMTFHGNVNSSNIFLTFTLKPLVSDYLPSIYLPHLNIYASEVTRNREVSRKADVYSFGVVLLELLTGKTPIFRDEFTSEEVELRRWILSVVEDELTSQIFELDLFRYENVEEDLVRLLQIAIDCTAEDPRNRPSMEQVRNRIEGCANFVEEIQDVHIEH